MAYRNNSQELRRYKTFCRDNFALIERIALPSFVAEDYRAFLYFIMHGETSPDAPALFALEDLTPEQRQAYLLLLNEYFAAGFDDPGLMGITADEREALRQKYPARIP